LYTQFVRKRADQDAHINTVVVVFFVVCGFACNMMLHGQSAFVVVMCAVGVLGCEGKVFRAEASSHRKPANALDKASGLLLDAKMQAEQMEALKQNVGELLPRVNAGGRKARAALIRLLRLGSEPNANTIMRVAGVEAAASRLMKSDESSEELQRLAGSMLTVLTGMPVSSELSDDKSGSYGRVNIVLPRPSRIYGSDRTMLELRSGVRPSETSVGDYLVSPHIDV
jgi:hypothetical protein